MTLINSRTLRDRIGEKVDEILDSKAGSAHERSYDKTYAAGLMYALTIISELEAEAEK